MNEEELRSIIKTAIPNLSESTPNKILKIPSYMLDFGYLETGSLYAGGVCIASETYAQVDLYYTNKTAFTTAKNILKKALIANKVFSDLESYFDTTSKYYRATFKVIVAQTEGE